MKVVYKYDLTGAPNTILGIRLPRGAKFLHAANLNGLKVWAEVDPQVEEELVYATIAFTGAALPDDGVAGGQKLSWEYLSTVIVNGYVLHIYIGKMEQI